MCGDRAPVTGPYALMQKVCGELVTSASQSDGVDRVDQGVQRE